MLIGFDLSQMNVAHAQDCLPTIVVEGYALYPDLIIVTIGDLYLTTPTAGAGPGGAYSANPNSHTNCTSKTLATALYSGTASTPSQPNNTSLTLPIRNANPIDISNGSPIGTSHGGVNGPAGFMIFPNLAGGTGAAMASTGRYASSGYTIAGLINAWAPPSINPNTMANMISALGISQAIANSTPLSKLTSTQLLQVVSAFAWQEGFHPSGC